MIVIPVSIHDYWIFLKHNPVELGITTGVWHQLIYTVNNSYTESVIDELSY